MSDLPIDGIQALLDPARYAHPVEAVRLVETHISWVLLTGSYAYKIKKPVDFGFLDFTTLEKRHFYCQEEIRLNRRLAPDYYLEVVPLYRTMQGLSWHGDGEIVEYAVKMRQFPQTALLSHLLEQGQLSAPILDACARTIADFHQHRADVAYDKGDAQRISQPVADNFRQIRELNLDLPNGFADLEQWSIQEAKRLTSFFEQRRRQGFIRECHGDMHLGNMAWIDDAPLIFDAIEFNPDFRWIDVISEVAFLMMDLWARERKDLAWRFIDAYLAQTGDYAGVAGLRFYLVYRAMVRAKIAALSQDEDGFLRYMRLADTLHKPRKPFLLLTLGFSGVGKSTLSQALLQSLGLVRLRSDVERKRLFGQQAQGLAPGEGIYTPAHGRQVYAHLLQQAQALLGIGEAVIVDAAFLQAEQRLGFLQWARDNGYPCWILDLEASPECLRQRIRKRRDDVSDADLAVLAAQLQHGKERQSEEMPHIISVNMEGELEAALDVVKQHVLP